MMTCGDGLFHQKEYQSNQNEEAIVALRGDGSFGMTRRDHSSCCANVMTQKPIDTSEYITAAVRLKVMNTLHRCLLLPVRRYTGN